jgi:Raf kinase inhibitor-like YbhB/YbcL family protein
MAFALVMTDVDVPGTPFIHWLLFNIPADINQLPAAVPRLEYFEIGTVQVRNSTGRIGYDGPSPPPGELHHYQFTLFALDAPLALGALASAQQVLDAIRAHTLDTAVLVSTYGRPEL